MYSTSWCSRGNLRVQVSLLMRTESMGSESNGSHQDEAPVDLRDVF